jgi:hypothetical protein
MRRSLILLLALTACGDGISPLGVLGTWGGESIRLDVNPAGASFHAPCLYGTLDGPLLPDGAGRFEVPGSISIIEGAAGGNTTTDPVTYRGFIEGQYMSLIIDRGAGSDELLLLIRHKSPTIPGCP